MKRMTLGVVGLVCLATTVSTAALDVVPSNATSPAATGPAPAPGATQPIMPSLPQCAANCTAAEIPKSTCQPTDFACICTNQPLNAAIGACIVQNCTVIESLQAQKYQKVSCGAPVRRNTDQPPITWALFGLSFVAVGARLVSKVPSLHPAFTLGWDDAIILTSMLALVGADIGSQVLVGLGLGQDIWMLDPDNITQILLGFFIEEILYSYVVAVTKLSIIIFYLRLFSEPWFRRVCYAILTITILYGIGQILAVILVCTPVQYNWTQWDRLHEGTCGKQDVMAFTNGGINIAIDFALFVLPVTQFITVSWTLKKKIGVSLIFLVGLFVTVSSCIRMATVAKFGGTLNPTFDYKELSIWSLIEMHVSVICACMPGMTAFIRRLKPRLHCQRPDVDPDQLPRNQPRTGRGVIRRIRETLTRITAPRDNGEGSAWKKSKATTRSTVTGTMPSVVDPEAPEYRDYIVYAPYAEGENKGIQLNDLDRGKAVAGASSNVREITERSSQ